MKKSYRFNCLVFLFFASTFYAQTTNHLTVEKVKVVYKIVSNGSGALGRPDPKVLPEAVITLKTIANISKIYLKILDNINSSLIYQVDYNTNSQPVTNAQGVKLFYRDNFLLHIGDPNTLSLKLYKYQIITEDSEGNKSEIFEAVQ